MVSAKEIFCFEKSNNIRNDSVALLMRRGPVRIHEWNELISRIIEAGLVGKWARDQRKRNAEDPQMAGTPMGLQHFYGGFGLCIFFWIIAIIVFILELIIHRKLQGENPHRFWRTADWVIDGKRHMLKLHTASNRHNPK